MITYYIKDEANEGFRVIDHPQEGCWIHIDEACQADINELCNLSGIEHSDVYDCLDKYEIPRIERIDGDVLIFTRYPAAHQEAGLYTTTLTIILNKTYFVTVCPHKSSLISHFLRHKSRIAPFQQSKYLLSILLRITQEYTTQIRRIRSNVLKQEKDITKVDSDDIIALTRNEENLSQYLNSLIPLKVVLEEIVSSRHLKLQEEDQDMVEDLVNAIVQSENLCSVNLRSIRSLRDSYQIIFTNQLNKTIKFLTALTIILSLGTMIASLYGMNVTLPFRDSPFAFGGIVLLIVLISYTGLMIFKKKRWI